MAVLAEATARYNHQRSQESLKIADNEPTTFLEQASFEDISHQHRGLCSLHMSTRLLVRVSNG